MHRPRKSLEGSWFWRYSGGSLGAGGGSASGVDATGDGDRDGDAPEPDAATFDAAPLGPFANVTPLSSLDTLGNEDDPTLTGDLLEIYFDRGGDIWYSTRASVADAWQLPLLLTAVNSVAT